MSEAGGAPVAPPVATGPRHGRAGRNLPVAIAVSLALGALIVVPLATQRKWFVAVLVAAVVVGLAELRRALAAAGLRVPVLPLLVGGSAMPLAAYADGPEALVVTLFLTCSGLYVWRLADGPRGYLPDVSAGVLAAVYVPFCAGFCALLVEPSDGSRRVLVFIVVVVCSDIGGYFAGVLAGRHPMAPVVSPKKSWEGFAGSVLLCTVAGTVLLPVLFDDGALWEGALFGLACVISATVGDLGESMLKRDLGIKDMGHLLPAHGGLMDRLDSLLPTAPLAWLLLAWFVPVP